MRHKKQLHLVQVFGGIICYNSISWLPFVILALLSIAAPCLHIPEEFALVSCRNSICLTSSGTPGPILETTLISDIRQEIKKIVVALCGCCKRKGPLSTLFPPSAVSTPQSKNCTLSLDPRSSLDNRVEQESKQYAPVCDSASYNGP